MRRIWCCSAAVLISGMTTAVLGAPVKLSAPVMDGVTAAGDYTASSLQDVQRAYTEASQQAINNNDAAALEKAYQDYQAALATADNPQSGDDTPDPSPTDEATDPTRDSVTDIADAPDAGGEEFDKTATDATTKGEVSVSVTDTADGSTATGTATASTEGGLATVFVGADAEPTEAHARAKAFAYTTPSITSVPAPW